MKSAALIALGAALVAFGLSCFHVLAPTSVAPQMLLILGMILALFELINASDRRY